MLGKSYATETCSIARALEVVGERWSLLIVRDALFVGSTRFSDFQRLGIATNVLAQRLDGFVAAGIMERHRYSERPTLYEYRLTAKGRDLAPALIALSGWGDRWAAPDGPPMLYRHAGCGAGVASSLTCATCGHLDDPAAVAITPGPGMPAERIASRADAGARRPRRRRAAPAPEKRRP